jgi:tRNA U54 and U55 pseudouridine synthase Pus10
MQKMQTVFNDRSQEITLFQKQTADVKEGMIQLEKKLQSEMSHLIETAQSGFQKELGSTTQAWYREMLRLKDEMTKNSASMETSLQNKIAACNNQLQEKEQQIQEMVQALKAIQSEVSVQQTRPEAEWKALEDKMTSQIQGFSDTMVEFKTELYQQILKEILKDKAKYSDIIDHLRIEMENLKESVKMITLPSLPSSKDSSSKPNLIQRFWRYLDTPVITLRF